MKKIVLVSVIAVLTIINFYKVNSIVKESNFYPMTAKIIEIDRMEDIVTVEDSTGNVWEFYGVEDFEKGDCVSMIMNNKDTESIFDDEIINVKYSAWDLEE